MTDDPGLAELTDLATRLAPTLVGLTREGAQARIAVADPRLAVRFVEADQLVTMEYRFGRITATLAAGVVTRASVG